jgi:anion-transporting  ArsA/GET3 family ATPase
MHLFDRQLIYVTGKGGVGRSTVAASLGLAASQRGRRTIVCEVAEQDRLSRAFGKRDRIGDEETELAEDLWGISIDPWAALRDWLASQLGSRMLSRVLFENNAFRYFAAAAPGAREMATIVKVWELARADYDTVIVDAPASGHGIGMLRTPRTFAALARVGPIRRQSDRVQELLEDTRRTAYVAVALAEEMPVNETLELEQALPDVVGHGLSAVVVNGVFPRRFSKAEGESLVKAVGRPGPAGPRARRAATDVRRAATDARHDASRAGLRAARAEERWARGQQSQLARLRRRARAPVITLPFLFAPELGLDELERLAAELGRKLA